MQPMKRGECQLCGWENQKLWAKQTRSPSHVFSRILF